MALQDIEILPGSCHLEALSCNSAFLITLNEESLGSVCFAFEQVVMKALEDFHVKQNILA